MNKKYTDKFQVGLASSKSHNVFLKIILFYFHSLKARGQHCFKRHSKSTSLIARSFELIKVFVLTCSLIKLRYLPKTSFYEVHLIQHFKTGLLMSSDWQGFMMLMDLIMHRNIHDGRCVLWPVIRRKLIQQTVLFREKLIDSAGVGQPTNQPTKTGDIEGSEVTIIRRELLFLLYKSCLTENAAASEFT